MIDRKEGEEQRVDEDDNRKRETHDINRSGIESEQRIEEDEAQIEEDEARNANIIALIPY